MSDDFQQDHGVTRMRHTEEQRPEGVDTGGRVRSGVKVV